jgi:hypothetical protein
MEAGISGHVRSIEELCGLLPEAESAVTQLEKKLLKKALGEA